MTLSAANTFTGGTTIFSGTLKLNGNTAVLGAGNVFISENAVLEISGALSGLHSVPTLSGSGAINITGTGNSYLSLANSDEHNYNGIINITGNLHIGYRVSNTDHSTILNLSKATISLESGQLALDQDANLQDTTTLTIKTLNGVAGTFVRAGGRIVTGGNVYSTLIVGDGNYNGIIGHNSDDNFKKICLVKNTSGTLTLSGSNNYAGGTTITGGTLKLNGNSAVLGAGNVIIDSESILEISGAPLGLHSVPSLSGTGAINITGTGNNYLSLANSDEQSYSGTITVTGNLHIGYRESNTDHSTILNLSKATISLESGQLALDQDANLQDTTTLTIKTLNGVAGTYVRAGGRIAMGGNVYSTLIVGDGDYKGIIGHNSDDNFKKICLVKNTSGTLTLSGTNNYVGGTTITSGTLKLTGAGTLGTGDVTLVTNEETNTSGTLEFNNSTAASIPSNISGSGNILVSAGTANLTGSVNQTGGAATLANGTTLNIGNESTVVNATLNNLAVVDENSSATLNITGNLTLNNSALTKFVGSITAPVVEKTGLDTLQLCFDAQNAVSIGSLVVSSGRVDLKGYMYGNISVDGPNAIFSPGNSVGDARFGGGYELKEGATLLIEQDETGIDTLTASSFDINPNSILELTLGSVEPGKTYDIIIGKDRNNADVNFTGTLADDNFWNGLLTPESAYYWNLSVSGNVVRATVDANAVPEPSTWALLILGTAGLLYVRKRIRK